MENDLADYIFNYCFKFYNENEQKAKNHHFWEVKFGGKYDGSGPLVEFKLRTFEQRLKSDDPAVLSLLQHGYPHFMMATAERIYREHRSALNLNLCPKCQKIARTPMAKQCRHCRHDWHN